ncbi:MAG TPA: outer membrane beta-barrel protein [Candidatus Limnocylindria bacterium]|jgi:hypothetical protein|nr:outer membrane beta-barrel protein [Candidatus Limnocylindria bacterium]
MQIPISNRFLTATVATLCSLSAISQTRAGGDSSASAGTAGSWYKAEELSIDLFGSGSIGQQTIDHLSGSRVSDNVRLGVGAGVNYFITRYLGVGGEVYTENTDHYFVDSGSVNFIGRLPIGESGLAPYAFAGVGYQFDRLEQCFGQLGVGVEVRFHENWSIFTDARYVVANRTDNYGLGRIGVRFVF